MNVVQSIHIHTSDPLLCFSEHFEGFSSLGFQQNILTRKKCYISCGHFSCHYSSNNSITLTVMSDLVLTSLLSSQSSTQCICLVYFTVILSNAQIFAVFCFGVSFSVSFQCFFVSNVHCRCFRKGIWTGDAELYLLVYKS